MGEGEGEKRKRRGAHCISGPPETLARGQKIAGEGSNAKSSLNPFQEMDYYHLERAKTRTRAYSYLREESR